MRTREKNQMEQGRLGRTGILFIVCILMLMATGCARNTEDPGTPPAAILNSDSVGSSDNSADSSASESSTEYGAEMEKAVSVRIGDEGEKDWYITMYNNDAANTMLDYLTSSQLRFPTYTYEEEAGFVAQTVQGSYTRNDEVTVKDIKAGELYLFSDGQLRLYFKDVAGANITATPVGYFEETDGLAEAVPEAYESNLGDSWGVSVYFLITKRI